MKWAILLICLLGSMVYKTESGKIVKTNEEWVSQVGPPSARNRQSCSSCQCGVPKTKQRIIGGVEAKNTEFPWIGYLQTEDQNGSLSCGSALINDRYVITAAHCIRGTKDKATVIIGLDDIENSELFIYRTVDKIIIHENYEDETLKHDIALVRLSSPVDISAALDSPNYIRPVCLPDASANFIGKQVTAIGWGLDKGVNGTTPDVLQKVNFPVLEHDICKTKFGPCYIPETMICAGYEDGSKGICRGDSGGPINYYNEDISAFEEIA